MSSAVNLVKLAMVAALAGILVASHGRATSGPVVHEWGTFTSVAGRDGAAVQWAPLSGTPDLPCFVNQLSVQNLKLSPGLVRMETPVVYFYAEQPVRASVHVQFPQGIVSEWFPQATDWKRAKAGEFSLTGPGHVDWDGIEVDPGQSTSLPMTAGPSRYYAARNTDSTPITVRGEREKFLFYRGVGDFRVALEPRFTAASKMEIRNQGAEAIPLAIVFENRAGAIGYRLIHHLVGRAEVNSPELNGNLRELESLLAGSLMEFGLYRKEAQAMVDTWQDSWFEEGTRVFYVLPRATVDSVLPIEVTPEPSALNRVFVGRAEVMAPWTAQAITEAIGNGETETLVKFDRFLYPMLVQLVGSDPSKWSPNARRFFDSANIRMARNRAQETCVR